MTTALANVQYKPTELDTNTLGSVLVKSGFFQDTKDVAQAIVKVLAGRELGFGPIASMQGVYIVKGRVTLSANLVGAAIQRSGKYNYKVKELTNERCVLVFTEHPLSTATFESIFTMQDAVQAGIAADTYKKFPRNMLFARALTNGARWFCPEVFNGPIYTPDELGAVVTEEGRVIDADSGEVLSETPVDEDDDETRLATAKEEWAATSAEASRLGIKHKQPPADVRDIEGLERWTIALNQRIKEHAVPA